MVVGRDEQGSLQVLRRRSEEAPVELGTVKPMEEGKPIEGEVVSLRPRRDLPFVFDVKTELPAPPRLTNGGPPQVATDSYRAGWDAIWGPPDTRRLN